jgi:two-component system, chemotaxis family, chemotaxis protein CheY
MWKILVVDDNFVNRKLLVEILKTKAQCDVAANGKEAMEAYTIALQEKAPYDVILLDIAMPEMNGLEVLHQIRKREGEGGVLLGVGVPIIMITAYKDPCFEAFRKGCDDYMLKPIDGSKLLQKIEEKLKK